MSDELTTEAVEAEVITAPEVAGAEPQGDAESTDWKAEARKHEKRAKENFEAAQRWREYEASLKPAQERMADELAAAKAAAESAQTALVRYEVAAEKNIPANAIALLNGSTREELESAADVLLALIAESRPKTPKPNESQGKPAEAVAGQITDPEQLKSMTPSEVMTAQKEGRLDVLLGKN